MLRIDIDRLPESAPPSLAATLFTAEAARHMLALHHAPSPPDTTGTLRDWNDTTVPLGVWWTASADPYAPQTHANLKDAAEHGAYGLAIAVMRALGYRVLGRAWQGSGADWLLLKEGAGEEEHIRLEVHGTNEGAGLERRLGEKADQLRRRPGPGFAFVVRFSDVRVLMAWVG